jgi:hypothetical protein
MVIHNLEYIINIHQTIKDKIAIKTITIKALTMFE